MVRPGLVPVPRSALWVPRPVLLWVTEVRPVLLKVVLPDRGLVLCLDLFPDQRLVPVSLVPVLCLVPARFRPPACPALPEHRQATADAVASLAA